MESHKYQPKRVSIDGNLVTMVFQGLLPDCINAPVMPLGSVEAVSVYRHGDLYQLDASRIAVARNSGTIHIDCPIISEIIIVQYWTDSNKMIA